MAQFRFPNPIEAIVAVDEENGYSKEGKIPWYYPEDFKWFRFATRDCIGLMGSGTYYDICERLGDKAKLNVLPGRQIFVLSSRMKPVLNATVVHSFEDFMFSVYPYAMADTTRKVVFLGGEQIYEYGIPYCDRIHITRIHKKFGCDRFFPYTEQQLYDKGFYMTYSDKRSDQFTMETYSKRSDNYPFHVSIPSEIS